MKKITILAIIFIIISCKTPNIEYVEYQRKLSDSSVQWGLKKIDVINNNESALLFCIEFRDEPYLVKNGRDTVYNGKIKTHETMGFAKVFKIYNDREITLYDAENKKYRFKLKPSQIKQHKFIFIDRNPITNEYKITISNSLRPIL
jgi:hypothetical protein